MNTNTVSSESATTAATYYYPLSIFAGICLSIIWSIFNTTSTNGSNLLLNSIDE
jgi:hypothetical protein